jgi:hypothetical protein
VERKRTNRFRPYPISYRGDAMVIECKKPKIHHGISTTAK